MSETAFVESEMMLALAGDEGMDFTSADGQRHFFKPDETKGYMRFHLAQGFPNVLAYGTALAPQTVANSFASLLHQPFDYEHQIAAYHDDPEGKKPNHVTDRILGSVVAVDFPRMPQGGWKIGGAEEAPKIVGVAAYAKLAQGMRKVLGEHATGRHRWTVSMECNYSTSTSGFAIERAGKDGLKDFAKHTPDDLAKAGFDYVPVKEAPDDVLATFSRERKRIVKTYKSRKAYLLMGGLDGSVHFSGVGLVRYGAEPKAAIQSMAASATPPLLRSLDDLADLFRRLAEGRK